MVFSTCQTLPPLLARVLDGFLVLLPCGLAGTVPILVAVRRLGVLLRPGTAIGSGQKAMSHLDSKGKARGLVSTNYPATNPVAPQPESLPAQHLRWTKIVVESMAHRETFAHISLLL